jgi:hypothetical protein
MKRDLKMNNKSKNRKKELVTGGILLGVGAVLFAASLLFLNISAAQPYIGVVQGFCVFLITVGFWNFFQYYHFQKNPAALQKARVDEMDERKLWIRYRSGNNAFKFGITTTYLALLLTGATNHPVSSDWVWWGLAGIVVTTMIVYIVSLMVYEKKY